MLEHLHIRNVALIKESEISFGDGLNILTGETGAGKSMIIDSLQFALGGRAGKDFLRHGEKQAAVEALFSVQSQALTEKLAENGIHRGICQHIALGQLIGQAHHRPVFLGVVQKLPPPG